MPRLFNLTKRKKEMFLFAQRCISTENTRTFAASFHSFSRHYINRRRSGTCLVECVNIMMHHRVIESSRQHIFVFIINQIHDKKVFTLGSSFVSLEASTTS